HRLGRNSFRLRAEFRSRSSKQTRQCRGLTLSPSPKNRETCGAGCPDQDHERPKRQNPRLEESARSGPHHLPRSEVLPLDRQHYQSPVRCVFPTVARLLTKQKKTMPL